MTQPTLSRLENTPDWRTLAKIGLGLIELYYRSFKVPPKRILLDMLDDTAKKREQAPPKTTCHWSRQSRLGVPHRACHCRARDI